MNVRELAKLFDRVSLDRELGKRSFAEYIKINWPVVEPKTLLWNWHLDAMAEFCTGLLMGHFNSGIINVPPGMSKSMIISTLFPSWCWVQNPTLRIIAATYVQDLSNKNAKLHRDLVLSDFHQARWPEVVIDRGSAQKIENFWNTALGWRFSSSVGGKMTGYHADILIFDDLIKAQDASSSLVLEKAADFWFNVMSTRRTDARSLKKLGIMQRLSDLDVTARCIETGEYEVLSLPMEFNPDTKCIVEVPGLRIEDARTEPGELLDPRRFPREVVDEDKKRMGPRAFAAQMQQDPVPAGGNIVDVEWFKHWDVLPGGMRQIITVDAAFKDDDGSDYVVVQVWGVKRPNYYLVDQMRERANVLRTCDMVVEMKRRHPRAIGVYIEDKANGPAVISILKSRMPGVVAWPEKGSKMTGLNKTSRLEAVASLFEAGNVFIPPKETEWLMDYMKEMTRFPFAKNDDMVDATTMGLLVLHRPQHRSYLDAIKKMVGK